jgi:mRNA-degrading endonuclease RelE of RelBE toxin-antitoxin system
MKRVLFRPQAAGDLDRLPNRTRDQVEEAIERFAQSGSGDIKMLAGEGRQLRLRVGDWQVRFVYEKPGHHPDSAHSQPPGSIPLR